MTFDRVLALDIAGTPYEWISAQEAVTLYARGKVAWDLGTAERIFHGGMNRAGQQSSILIRPILAMAGSDAMVRHMASEIALTDRGNALLFARDRNTCGYCGQVFPRSKLTRDHIVPRSRGGANTWMNCITACVECNQAKADRRVEDFRPLVMLPYVPNRFEHFILSGRNILADQHEYLAAKLPAHSRLRH